MKAFSNTFVNFKKKNASTTIVNTASTVMHGASRCAFQIFKTKTMNDIGDAHVNQSCGQRD